MTLKKEFKKPALSLDGQLAKLVERGLVVSDVDLAKHYLREIGYYRFSGYSLPFQNGGDGHDRHRFTGEVTFEAVLDRYVFDRKLRLHLMDAIERIEVSMRAALSNAIATKHGAHWYRNDGLFQAGYDHPALIKEIQRQIGHGAVTDEQKDKQDTFIRSYYSKYYSPDMPPSWMVFECISFGTISRIFENLYKSETSDIYQPYGIPHDVMASWLHAISYVRNLCAHHKRTWNKVLTIKPTIAKKHKTKFRGNNKIYGIFVIIQILLKKVSPDNSWAERLKSLLEEHPDIPLANMGVPDNWHEIQFWKLSAPDDVPVAVPQGS